MMSNNQSVHKATRRALAACLLTVLTVVSCSLSPEERVNPLDPVNWGDLFQATLVLVDTVVDTTPVRKIQISWEDIDHAMLTEYHVYRRIPVQSDGYLLVDVTQPPLTTYTDFDAVADSSYTYRLWAIFDGGADSVFSDEIRYLGRFDDRY